MAGGEVVSSVGCSVAVGSSDSDGCSVGLDVGDGCRLDSPVSGVALDVAVTTTTTGLGVSVAVTTKTSDSGVESLPPQAETSNVKSSAASRAAVVLVLGYVLGGENSAFNDFSFLHQQSAHSEDTMVPPLDVAACCPGLCFSRIGDRTGKG